MKWWYERKIKRDNEMWCDKKVDVYDRAILDLNLDMENRMWYLYLEERNRVLSRNKWKKVGYIEWIVKQVWNDRMKCVLSRNYILVVYKLEDLVGGIEDGDGIFYGRT